MATLKHISPNTSATWPQFAKFDKENVSSAVAEIIKNTIAAPNSKKVPTQAKTWSMGASLLRSLAQPLSVLPWQLHELDFALILIFIVVLPRVA